MKKNYETIIRDHVLAEKRLRDAAPDLLEALEAITNYVELRWGYSGTEIKNAADAIAKAKGEA